MSCQNSPQTKADVLHIDQIQEHSTEERKIETEFGRINVIVVSYAANRTEFALFVYDIKQINEYQNIVHLLKWACKMHPFHKPLKTQGIVLTFNLLIVTKSLTEDLYTM